MRLGSKETERFKTAKWPVRESRVQVVCITLVFFAFAFFLISRVRAQSEFEHNMISKVDISFGGDVTDIAAAEPYRVIINEAIGDTYSATRLRDSIQALHNTGKIESVVVEAKLDGVKGVDLKYTIKRKRQAEKVSIEIGRDVGSTVKEQDLLFKLNLIPPGTTFTELDLQNNADQILDYLRARGFYRSEVKYVQNLLPRDNSVGIVFNVTPNEQAKVESFKVNIDGYKKPILAGYLSLEPGEYYEQEKLDKDVEKIKALLRKSDFSSPELDDPRVSYDSEKNTIAIEMTGKVGPTVRVTVDANKDKLNDRTLSRLLPVKRDGSLDYAAIVEGERRLESYYQEKGFFFADATPICSVEPPIGDGSDAPFPNNTEFLCSVLRSADLGQRTVTVNYKVDKNRKLKLVSVRIRGTDELPIDEIRTILESQEANALGIIPLFGYGRGFTSSVILERDAATIRSLMNELGYRDAEVRVNQGVSPNGEDLIITFQVEPGPPTTVESVAIAGNKAISTSELTSQIPDLTNGKFSRARVRNAVQKLVKFYSDHGYFDARITSSITEITPAPLDGDRKIRIDLKVENEGRRVVINRVMVSGNEKTKEKAILRTTTLRKGDFLRSTDLYLSEQNLYASDAFDKVEIKPQPAGNAPNGDRLTDVVVDVNEQPSRLLMYGGGYSTDLGFSGFFDIRHVNLFGNLWQGGARVRWSQLQQLVQFDFVNPRFTHDGERRYTPLTISVQYQRDSTVTRFFRSAFDKGTYGIVQRIDENGNPIDIFGNRVGSPTINRLSLTAETSRTISRKDRSIIFARYRFEDVRLANVESLLIKDLLIPDSRVRISGPGITFVRDTRVNCLTKYSVLELIAKGEPSDKCRYSATDPTNGDYLTIDYSVSFTQLGGNFGFQKFQGNYRKYFTFPKLKNTTVAAQLIVGLANVFANGDRYTDPQFAGLNGILPISERFFAGGSTTLRGFDFEEAGPRVVIAPQGTFLDSNRQPVTLQPFTIPIGGNALAIVNLEARVPISKSVRFVPFYDGGNVFERVGDIFNPRNVAASNASQQNLRAKWTHTAGIGLRIKTPVGGEFAVDYGYLLNPPRFLIPQTSGPDAIYRLHQGQFHFRFSQAF